MRLSCCAYSYRQFLTDGTMTLEAFIQTARDIGFDGVELTAYYFPTTDRPYLNDLKRLIHRQGLSVSGTAIGSDFAQPDAEKRLAHIAMTRQWIDHSVILGAPTLRVFAGAVREGHSEAESFAWVVECLRECADYAAQQGVLLALENHGGLTATSDQTLALHQAVGSDWLGINLDFGNFKGDAYTQFGACAPFAVSAHAKSHFTGHSGRELVDYARVRDTLAAADYRGFVAIEYEEAEDPRTAVPQFARGLREAL